MVQCITTYENIFLNQRNEIILVYLILYYKILSNKIKKWNYVIIK
jgi:hypothetical protein